MRREELSRRYQRERILKMGVDLDIILSTGLARVVVGEDHDFGVYVSGVTQGLERRGCSILSQVTVPEKNTCYFCFEGGQNA